VVYGATEFNVGNGYNTTTSIFTVPSGWGGYYSFNASFQQNTSAQSFITIYKNGSAVRKTGCPATGTLPQSFVLTVSAIQYLAVGDQILVNCFSNSAQTIPSVAITNFFQGQFLHS
jgi:hypothetical protein